MTRSELLLLIYKETDEIIKEHFQARQIKEWPCGPGCSECCTSTFTVNSLEFKVIQKHLQGWSVYPISRLQNRLDRFTEKLNKHHPEIAQFLIYIDQNRSTLSQVDSVKFMARYEHALQKAKNIPCPFLDRSLCTIYEYRPLVCRTYGITYEAPKTSLIKYNVCEKMNLEKCKPFLLDSTYVGLEADLLTYNKDHFPLLIWLDGAIQEGLSNIPNEKRDFEDHYLTIEQFRLSQKSKTDYDSFTEEERNEYENIVKIINQR